MMCLHTTYTFIIPIHLSFKKDHVLIAPIISKNSVFEIYRKKCLTGKKSINIRPSIIFHKLF